MFKARVSHNTFILISSLVILISIPLSLRLLKMKQDIRRQAKQGDEGVYIPLNTKHNLESNYVLNEVIVKLESKLQLRSKNQGISINLDENPVEIGDIDPGSLPDILKSLQRNFPLNKIEKIIKKDVGTISGGKSLRLEDEPIYLLKFKGNAPIDKIISRLETSGSVVYAEPNFIVSIDQLSDDPYFLDSYPDNVGERDPNWNPTYDYQWNLKSINAQSGWLIAPTSNDVIIAVIDTGVDYFHTELSGSIILGYDFVNADSDPMDDNGHGTHIAGISVAKTGNSIGVASVCPQCKVLAIKALDSKGQGSIDNLTKSVIQAVSLGAKIINASWGAFGESQLLNDAINSAYSAGVLTIASAGNNSNDAGSYLPSNVSCLESFSFESKCVLTVSSFTQTGSISNFSNWGNVVDVGAPGGNSDTPNIISTKSASSSTPLDDYVVGNEYVRMHGTSMAAPHVSGLAGLIIARGKELNRTYTPKDIFNIIINGADDAYTIGFDLDYGNGRINVDQTLSLLDPSDKPVARVSFPRRLMYVSPKFTVRGTAGGSNFESYEIEYAESISATTWSNQGVILTNGGSQAIVNGDLATVDVSPISSGHYFFRLTVKADGEIDSTYFDVIFDDMIRDNFPVIYKSESSFVAPAVSDINGDSISEMIYLSRPNASIEAVQADGSNLSGWPVDTGTLIDRGQVAWHTTVGEFDSDISGEEVLSFSHWGGLSPQWGFISGFYQNGNRIAGWSKDDGWEENFDFLNYHAFSLDNIDGSPYILFPESPIGTLENATLHLFDANKNQPSNWPIQFTPDSTNTRNFHFPAMLYDLDANGTGEVVVIKPEGLMSKPHELIVYDLASTQILFTLNLANEIIAQVNLADLERDGFMDIVLSTYERDSLGKIYRKKIYAIDHSGDIKAGFPYILSSENAILIEDTMSLGDFNNDGFVDIFSIAVENSQVTYHAIDKDANPINGFPYTSSSVNAERNQLSSVVNVSLKNGKHLFSYTAADNIFLIEYDPLSGTFSDTPGFPKHFEGSPHVIPSLVDLENDGILEIVFPNGLEFKDDAYLFVLDLAYEYDYLDWPQYMHDAARTGTYVYSDTIPPIPTSGPSPTPTGFSFTPSPAPTGSSVTPTLATGVTLDFTLGFQAVPPAVGFDYAVRDVRMNLVQENTSNLDFSFDATVDPDVNGIYQGSVSGLSPGIYDIYIKDPNHLQRKYSSIDLTNSTNFADFTTPVLLAGDFDNDNILNIVDVALILSRYTQLSTPVGLSNFIYDINRDGFINIIDISVVLSNYTALNIVGDNF